MGRVIIRDSNGRLATAIRRALAGAAANAAASEAVAATTECRSLAECERRLAQWPASLVVLECNGLSLPADLTWLARLELAWPAARCAVALEPDASRFEPLLREAGAIEVVSQRCDLQSIVRLAARHLARSPQEPLTPTQEILAKLPWP